MQKIDVTDLLHELFAICKVCNNKFAKKHILCGHFNASKAYFAMLAFDKCY